MGAPMWRDGVHGTALAGKYEPTFRQRRMFGRFKIFTSGMAAAACRVAPRTFAKWCDAGKVKCYRLPLSNDRRIERHELVRFMKDNGIPLDAIGGEEAIEFVALLAGCTGAFSAALAEALGSGWRVERASCLFDAALAVAGARPDAAVFDCSLGHAECADSALAVRRAVPEVRLVGVLADDAADAPGCYDLTLRASDGPAAAADFLRGEA